MMWTAFVYHKIHFRRLLFLAPENLMDTSTGVGSDLPYSYVLNHLFCRGPVTLKSPYKVSENAILVNLVVL